MRRAFILTAGIAFAASMAMWDAPVWAQFGSSGGGRTASGSGFGQSGFGSGVGSGLGGSGGFGSGTNGFSGFGGSAFGNSSSFGGSFGNAFGSNGFGSGGGGLGGGLGGQQGFGGQQGTNAAQGGQNFIGRSGSDMQSMMKAMGEGSNQFFRQLNRTLGQANRGKQGSQQNENAELPVRVKLTMAYDASMPAPTNLAATIQQDVDKVLAAHKIAAPNIELDGGTVVLTGTAASDSQRLVIEKLVSLEPGVSEVLNQMTVSGSSPAEPGPQPAGN